MPSHIRIPKGQKNYIALLSVPPDVRSIIGKTQFKKSLKTDHKPTAQKLANQIVPLWQAEIDAARGSAAAQVNDKLSQLQSLLSDIRQDIAATTDSNEAENLWHAMSATEDEVASILGIDHTDSSDASIKAYKTAVGLLTPFDTHIDAHLAKSTTTDKTKFEKRKAFADFIAFTASKPVERLTKADVAAFINDFEERGKAPQTIQKTLSHLATYWRWAWPNNSDIFARPSIKQPRLRKVDMRQPFSIDDLHRIHQRLVEYDHAPLLLTFDVSCFTGMRIEEICQLRLQDIDLTQQTFNIISAKTTAGERVVPIAKALLPAIKEAYAASVDDYLIDTSSNNHKYNIRSAQLSKRFGRVKKAMGFDDRFVFHSIRKTVATLFETCGVRESVAADILGHEKQTMTYGLYSGGSSIEQKREAVEAVAAVLAMEHQIL